MAAPSSVASAVGAGDYTTVKRLLESGADANKKSRDGMTPLAVAAFWGYDHLVDLLIEKGADINACNSGTLWTALHCAAFQGHGKVIMTLMDRQPDLYKVDTQGRSAVDFASAHDSIWAFFAAAGCKRTPKADLVRMDIVKKVSKDDPSIPSRDVLEFSRPGSAYIFNDNISQERQEANVMAASAMGDVLAGVDDDREQERWSRRANNPSLSIWNN
ncbi:delta-latroinsectotoxin-Lt1a [Aplysia californica]|uniref:Delta-latroinsectotoxin-Lt1a n=1 Tax=Aplysia californica TaxID=6500 RepID=A0ABM0K3N0_APLCA|nr:delta-latroinsectotoxin-Lt1a [Aplysia californica]